MTMQSELRDQAAIGSIWIPLALAVLGVLAFNLSSAWALLFLANIDIGLPIVDAPIRGTFVSSVVIDSLLMAAFGLHHSAMARPRMRRHVARLMGEVAERPFYVLCSSGALMAIMALWQPIPIALWSVTGEPARIALWTLYGAGWVLVVGSLKAIDEWSFLGVRRIVAAFRSEEPRETPFMTPMLYRAVRHPMYLGLIIAFWATPNMTAGHALYAGGMTLYILIGIRFEERGLIATYGDTYRDYQRRVPMLVPWRRAG